MQNRHVVEQNEFENNGDKESNTENMNAERIDDSGRFTESPDGLFSGKALRTSGFFCHLRRNTGMPHLPKFVPSC